MVIALNIAILVISIVLCGLVIVQSRTAGFSNRDTSSIHHTRRGVEKTMHQATIVMSGLFLLLSLIASLPLFGA